MLSVIEVQCPHCGARGTIMLPPVGSVLIGPCPLCNEMVVLFAGRVMALDTAIMLGDDLDAKRDHLVDVLMGYIRERVDEVLDSVTVGPSIPDQEELGAEVRGEAGGNGDGGTDAEKSIEVEPTMDDMATKRPISKEEAEDFLRIDLPLLAKAEYFRAFFGEAE